MEQLNLPLDTETFFIALNPYPSTKDPVQYVKEYERRAKLVPTTKETNNEQRV